MQFEIIIVQIIILAILAGIGVVAAKLNVITEEVKNSIAVLIFNITLPLLLITSITKLEIDQRILTNAIFVFIASLGTLSISLLVGKLSGKLNRLDPKKKTIHMLHTGFGNVAFLGYPLFAALFPGEGLFYAIIYHFSQDIFIWTVGVIAFNNHQNNSFKQNIKHLLNPNTVTFTVGIIMLAFHIKIPEFLSTPLSGFGKTTIYLAMLYIGAVLAQNPMISSFRKKEIYILIFNKMLLIPVLFGLAIKLISNILDISFSPVAITVLLMQAAMPCMAMVVVLAKRFGSDDIHATENLFLSTIFSLLTLPAIFYFVQILF